MPIGCYDEKTKPIGRPLAGNPKSAVLNPKRWKLKEQSQFAERPNERKLNFDTGLCEIVAPAVPPKQSQFEPNLL